MVAALALQDIGDLIVVVSRQVGARHDLLQVAINEARLCRSAAGSGALLEWSVTSIACIPAAEAV